MILWTPTEAEEVQTLHVCITLALLFGMRAARAWPFHWCLPLLAVWIAVKDFGFDLLVERDTFTGSLTDAAFYLLGVPLSYFLFALFRAGGWTDRIGTAFVDWLMPDVY